MPTSQLSGRCHNLPNPLSPLVGRERETAAIAGLLRHDGVRLVTLTGPGGVGKTRLALRVAADLAEAFPDGVWFVRLDAIADPGLVLPAVAQALGLRTAEGEPIEARLITALARDKRPLLVLDNFEQVVDAAPLVADLLAACPLLKALVTSRVRLRLSGEREYPVLPLSLTQADEGGGAERRGANASFPSAPSALSEAVRLFVERAQAVKPDFGLSADNARAVASICSRLDGLPLAIELAAARVKMLPPPTLLTRLERALPLLTGGSRDAPARQQTMRDAIAWSYDLLTDAEQTLFRRLSVFAGGFTVESVEAVVASSGDSGADVFEGVTSLLDKNLVRQEANPVSGAGGEPRFGMLETVREYALERLEASGEAERVRAAHAAHFLALIERDASDFAGAGQQASQARLSAELPNLRAAAGWLLRRGEAEPVLRLGMVAAIFLYVWGVPGEVQQWLDEALAVPGDVDPEIRAHAVLTASNLAAQRGDQARATALVQEALAIAREYGDACAAARALCCLGTIEERLGAFDRAAALCEEGLALLGGVGDGPMVDMVRVSLISDLADARVRLGNPEAAVPLAEDALTRWRALGHAWGEAQALQTLAAAASATGDQARAAGLYGEALSVRLKIDDRSGVAGALGGVAGVAVGLGKPDRAARLLGAAYALRDTIGLRFTAHHVRGEQVLADVRGRLDAPTFAAAWEAGRALSPEQAIAEAREVIAEALAAASFPAATSAPIKPAGLTPREVDVLRLLVEGRSDKEIAEALFIGPRTVQTHVANLFAKLGVHTRAEAAATAVRRGLA